jgi:AcrR family transcriptional regulator
MGKGEATRQVILDHAARLATQIGLEGLSIGRLADDLHLSKSGLFAHFRSKEALQVQVLDAAAERFVERCIRPALRAPRGEARVRAIFERWLEWARTSAEPGGCIFVASATELDDRPGAARDRLVALQADWMETLASIARTAIQSGFFAPGIDPEQFAHELYGLMLAYHHAARLMRDPRAEERTRKGFESLLAARRPA